MRKVVPTMPEEPINDHHTVRGTASIEFDPVGAEFSRQAKGGQCVLRRGRRRTTVGNDQGHAVSLACRF